MERSGSQKALLVISIIEIVLAAIILIGSLLAIVGGAMVGAADVQTAAEIANETGFTSGEVGAIATIGGVVALLVGAIELLVGILGVRAANDNQKIMPVWVLALISLIMNVVSAGASIVSNTISQDATSMIIGIAMSALIFWIANNVKREAGR